MRAWQNQNMLILMAVKVCCAGVSAEFIEQDIPIAKKAANSGED